MSTPTMTREERTTRLADLRAREAARKVVLSGTPLMDLPLDRRIAFALFDPGAITPRGNNYQEPLNRWQARAVNFVLPDPDAEFTQVRLERDRYRLAWQSARERAQAYGEGILRITGDRESYQEWLKQEQAATQQLRAKVAELMSEGHLTVADVVAFLVKKAREYGNSNRENRAKAEAVGTMASKISRGAIRPTEGGARS